MSTRYIKNEDGKTFLVEWDGMFETKEELKPGFDSSSYEDITGKGASIDDELWPIDERGGSLDGKKGTWKENIHGELDFTPTDESNDEDYETSAPYTTDDTEDAIGIEYDDEKTSHGKATSSDMPESPIVRHGAGGLGGGITTIGPESAAVAAGAVGGVAIGSSVISILGSMAAFMIPLYLISGVIQALTFNKDENSYIAAGGKRKYVIHPAMVYVPLITTLAGVGSLIYKDYKNNLQVKHSESIESIIESPIPEKPRYIQNGSGSFRSNSDIYYRIGDDGELILSNAQNRKSENKEVKYHAYTDVNGKTYLLDRPYVDGKGMAHITVPDAYPERQGKIETFSIEKKSVERTLGNESLYCLEELVGNRKFYRLEKEQITGLENKFDGTINSCKD